MIRQYLLDTNHAGEIYKQSSRFVVPATIEPKSVHLTLCYPSVGELWYMVCNSKFKVQNAGKLRSFLTHFFIHNFDARAAEEYGAIQTEVLKIGRPIKPLDIQIAAIARAQGLSVLTADKHFSYIPGITVENWLA